MSTKEKFEKFEQDLIDGWEEYSKNLKDLNSYRGKEIDQDTDKVNEVLANIQKSFHSIYPWLSFILKNYDVAKEALKSYEQFIEDIKKAGAVTEDEIKA